MYDLEKEREYIRLASDDPDLTPEEEYEFYKKYALRTKNDLLKEIRDRQKHVGYSENRDRSEEFYGRLNHLFDVFYGEVESHVIMEPLDNFWGYEVAVNETGITLFLAHIMLFYDSVDQDYPDWHKYSSSHHFASDDKFPILKTRANLMTLEEFGSAYNVGAGTVRQWIRRGKLRSASKFGKEWRIPELSDKPRRGYLGGHYLWRTDLPDPPEEIPQINDGDSLYIYKNNLTGEWTAKVECFYKKGTEREYVLTSKTKEKLELYLISHPLVECLNNYILEFEQKRGSEHEMMKISSRWLEIQKELDQILAKVDHSNEKGGMEGVEE